jgi:hypothetical protein
MGSSLKKRGAVRSWPLVSVPIANSIVRKIDMRFMLAIT